MKCSGMLMLVFYLNHAQLCSVDILKRFFLPLREKAFAGIQRNRKQWYMWEDKHDDQISSLTGLWKKYVPNLTV